MHDPRREPSLGRRRDRVALEPCRGLERERQVSTRVADDGQERVQVGGDQVDRLQTVPRKLLDVAGIVAQRQNAAVHGGVQCLDPPAEHLRETGDFLHAADGDAGFTQ